MVVVALAARGYDAGRADIAAHSLYRLQKLWLPCRLRRLSSLAGRRTARAACLPARLTVRAACTYVAISSRFWLNAVCTDSSTNSEVEF